MNNRLHELLELSASGDEDIVLQVASEIALMPETRRQRRELQIAYAEMEAETFASVPSDVTSEDLDKLAEEADF